MKKPKTAIAVATIYFVIFQLLLQLNSDVGVIFSMVFFRTVSDRVYGLRCVETWKAFGTHFR